MVNQQLVNYIKTEEAQGYTPRQLKNYLIQQGYSPQDVEEAINYANAKGIYSSSNVAKPQTQPKTSSKERPMAITVIAILYFISGGFSVIYGIIALIGDLSIATIPIIGPLLVKFVMILTFVSIAAGAINLIVGWGLWKLENWARILAIILTILSMFSIIGIPVAAIILYFLMRKETKVAFGVA